MKFFKKKFKLLMSFLVLFSMFFTAFSQVLLANSLPTFAIVDNETKSEQYKTIESSIQTVATPTFNFQSKAQVLMEQSTGKILYANNENEELLPASVTKVMTLILIMEAIDSGKIKLEDTVTCSLNASKMGRLTNMVQRR
ncbi:MAG: serine hydrolase [Clostridia bacterium]|nr:serine hydrolase [Clostridia bacterium]